MSAYKHSTVSLLALCCAFGTSGAFAQEETEAAAEREVLIVTGSRSTPRTVFESLAPVDVIGEQAIELTASDELPDVLAQLAPSFNVQRLPMADGQIFVRPARLRNLSPDHTLVLINGKRRHRSALLGSNGAQAPDLAQIPTSAIGRIEVLRDGASAQYGSDAIAGVINIILDDEVNANGFAQAGQYYEGDGLQYRLGAQHSLDLEDGFITGTIEYSDQEETSRSRQRPDAIAFQAANPGIQLDNPVQNWGQPTREALRLAVNSELEVDLGTAYIFGSYGTSDAVSDFNWRNPATTSAFNPSAAYPGFDLNTIYPAGFAPRFGQEDQDLSAVAGLRSDQDGAFTWDASLGFGRHEIDYKISETINASLGSDSPTAFKPGTLIQSEFNVNLDMAYRFGADMLASEGTIAFGVERREETFEI
jgi:iron complex outermembrane receptor protein